MANTNTTPEDRVRVFGRDGFPIAEFRPGVERSWAINDEGRAQFEYASRISTIVNEKVLQFGNWLLVESTALPAWVGVIDTPRKWGTREVVVHAYTPERVFSWRRGPLEEKLTGSAGQIFEKLITKVNTPERTILRVGNIWKNKKAHEMTLNPKKLSTYLKDLTERSGEEYYFRPVVNDLGQLLVYCDWYDVLGEKTSAWLHEGTGGGNVQAVGNIVTEDQDITNDLLSYGDGMAWNSKPFVVTKDHESIEKYGLRQDSQEFPGVSEKATLQKHGAQTIATLKRPEVTHHLNALNVGDTFKFLGLGNILKLQYQNAGFFGGGLGYQTDIRVMAMTYDPVKYKNLVELVVEEAA